MKVLVTGAGGAIGRVLGRGLPDQGHELRGLDLNEQSADDGTYALGWITGDCLDQDTVDRAVAGVDAVVHLVAAAIPDRAEDEFENAWVGGPHLNPSYTHAAF